jgi:2-hydroxychromene-2-carboxylate isomerase
MSQQIEFFFDFGSGPSYLAHTQLPRIAASTGAEVIYRPILLGGVFKLTGNTPPGAIAEKMAWFKGDLELWAKKYGVAYAFPKIPITNTMSLMRGAYVARGAGCFDAYCSMIFKAIWEEGLNVQDLEVFERTLDQKGFDSKVFLEGIKRPEIKEALIASTTEAVERGAFGTPTFFTAGRMFFGQDRLEFVEQAALGQL